jgi:hypothetical protein
MGKANPCRGAVLLPLLFVIVGVWAGLGFAGFPQSPFAMRSAAPQQLTSKDIICGKRGLMKEN